MEKKEILQAIENLGLSAYEAKAYYALLLESPLTGYKLSKVSGVPRSRIYETIEKLMAKGLVLSQEGDTTLLIPVSLESLLEKKEKESRRNIDFLKEILPQLKKPAEAQGIWSIAGRDRIFETINHLVSLAESHVYLVSFDSDIVYFESALSDSDGARVAVTKNPGIIHVAEDYIKHEIFLSQLFKKFDAVPSDELNTIYRKIMGNLP